MDTNPNHNLRFPTGISLEFDNYPSYLLIERLDTANTPLPKNPFVIGKAILGIVSDVVMA